MPKKFSEVFGEGDQEAKSEQDETILHILGMEGGVVETLESPAPKRQEIGPAHYTLRLGPDAGDERPATIVRFNESGDAELVVTMSTKDGPEYEHRPTMRREAARHGFDLAEWHYADECQP